MTFAAVGSLFQAAIGGTTFTGLTPSAVGNLIIVQVINESNSTVNATALSSSNITWAALGTHFDGATNTDTVQTFAGKVTTASTATVTITFSGTTPATTVIIGHEFSSTVGSWA